MPDAEFTFSRRALAKISGISRGQLIRWDRDGLIRADAKPPGCFYTREQALGILALGDLRRRGVSQRRIRTAAAVLPLISSGEHVFLVFDGQLMHARRTDAEVTDLLSGSGRACRVLKITNLAKKLVQA